MAHLVYKVFYGQQLSKIVFFMFFLVFAWAALERWFVSRLSKERLWQMGNAVCWLCMVFVILSVTVSSRNVGSTEVQWKPFYSLKAAQQQPEIYRSMLMNVFMFFPLGLSLPYALPRQWKHQALVAILFAVVFSVLIEFLQYYYCLGCAETDDVICNTLGCAIGTLASKGKQVLCKSQNDK